MVSKNIPQVKLGIIAVSRDCFPYRSVNTAQGEHRKRI